MPVTELFPTLERRAMLVPRRECDLPRHSVQPSPTGLRGETLT